MKPKVKLSFCLLFTCLLSYGQVNHYNYRRELKGVTETWHKVIIPDEVFEKASPSLADIRILGVTANDTLEVPYLLRVASDEVSEEKIAFKLLNTSSDDKGHYFEFQVSSSVSINQIELDFKQHNFDWRVRLEGSQDQKQWFTIIDDYRILSVKNSQTDFQFTKLAFPDSKYHYYRLAIPGREQPELKSAHMTQRKKAEGLYRNYTLLEMTTEQNEQSKQTVIEAELSLMVPVSHLKILVEGPFDYYRPITIQCVRDSFETQKGWTYQYSTLTSGILNSIGTNVFQFPTARIKKLRILIHNQNNQPLMVSGLEVKGFVHELVVRFTEPATYFLVYGNQQALRPAYDIGQFAHKIPDGLTPLTLGEEQRIERKEKQQVKPLFINQWWLWSVMVLIMVLLGWFSIKMLGKK